MSAAIDPLDEHFATLPAGIEAIDLTDQPELPAAWVVDRDDAP